jgi:hypothetical protein
MNFETDVPDYLTLTWDGHVKLKIARAEWVQRRRESLERFFKAPRIADMVVPQAPKFEVPAGPVFTLPTMTNLSLPNLGSRNVVYGGSNADWARPASAFTIPANTWQPRITSASWLPVLSSSMSSM